MSAKIAVVIGDYSNGWNNAIMVQQVGSFRESDCNKDREFVTNVMTAACLSVVEAIESNEAICPKPKDEPCCKIFESWAKRMTGQLSADDLSEMSMCPHCGTKITDERRTKYLS